MTKLADYRLPAPGAGLREGDPIRRYVSVWRKTAGYWSLCRSYPLLYLFSSDYFEDGTGESDGLKKAIADFKKV